MTARIVNLRTRRKQKARDEKRKKSDANAVQSGRSKTERTQTSALERLERKRLDDHKREDAD